MEHFYYKIDGWFDFQKIYSSMIKEFDDNSLFVELGSWLGRSTSYMGVELMNSGKKIKFHAIDLWEDDMETNLLMNCTNIYQKFLKNIEPVINFVTPIKGRTEDLYKDYDNNSIDFLFIDASHKYEDIKKDIELWYPKVKIDGYIGGHDYTENHPGVKKAVYELFGDSITIIDQSWLYKKKDNTITNYKFISSQRIDIIACYIYVKYYKIGKITDFFNNLYLDHKGSINKFMEEYKICDLDFSYEFNKLIENFDVQKMEKIKYEYDEDTNNYIVTHGAHRTSICILKNINIISERIEQIDNSKFYWHFDMNWLLKMGLKEKYADFITLEYIKIKPNCFSMILFLTENDIKDKYEQSLKIISEKSNIIRIKKFDNSFFTNNGKYNLIKYLYLNDEWCKRGGWLGKSNDCFKNNRQVISISMEIKKQFNIKELKNEIRNIFKRENHSCHCSDNLEDTLKMSQILLNENTLNYLNSVNPNFNFSEIPIIKDFYEKTKKLTIKEKDGICVTGSAVMTTYDLRECRDLDVFIDSDYLKESIFESHNCYAELNKNSNKNTFYKYHYLEIIHNPNYHFYINGIKFCNIDIIKDMKFYRYLQNSDKKDREDYIKINQIR